MMADGEKVWEMLRAEGGFVWTTASGRQFVRFNRGYRCSAKLRMVLKEHRDDLKAFVNQRHAELDRAWRRKAPGVVGSSGKVALPAPIGRSHDSCECNADGTSVYAHIALPPDSGADAGAGGARASSEAKPGADGGCAANFCAFGASGKKAEA